MKILRIITRLNIGGPAIQALSLMEYFPNTLLLTGYVSKREFNEKEILYSDNLKNRIIYINLKREISFKDDYEAFKTIRGIILQDNPVIVHTHMSKAGFLGRLAALSIRKKKRPKLIHTFHGHTFHSYFGYWKSLIFRLIEIFLAYRSDVIIAISESQKDDLIEYGLPKNKIRVVKLGFDLSKFLEIEKSTLDINDPYGILRIGFVGRLAPIKDIGLFVRVVQELKKYFAIEVYIAGKGDIEEEEKLKPIKDYIIERRWFSREEMPDFYRKIDVLVCTSKNEGTPVSIIEAMAAGRLVFAKNVGGIGDLISYDRNKRGVYINDRDDMTLSISINLLISCLKSSKKYDEKIYSAREYVRKNYDRKRLFKKLEKLYE